MSDLEGISTEELRGMVRLLLATSKKVSETRIDAYVPYEKQKEFHNCVDPNDYPAHQKFLQAANQFGKTKAAASEFSWHVTGEYPEWYTGFKLESPFAFMAEAATGGKTLLCENSSYM